MSERTTSAVTEQQLAHKSVRKYLDEPVSEAQLEAIVRSAQSSSTSSNLQVWSVIAVRDQERKDRISQALGGRAYIETAPVFLVWVADLARNREIMRSRGIDPETLGLMELTLMCALDTGIAAQNALLAAESLGLGGVFVGGIRNNIEAIVDELQLPPHVFPVVGMAIGVPDPSEGTGVKPRLPLSTLLHEEQYDTDAWRDGAEQFEGEFRDYFEGQGVPGRSWARTMSRRLGTTEGLDGRHTMGASLRAQGFATE